MIFKIRCITFCWCINNETLNEFCGYLSLVLWMIYDVRCWKKKTVRWRTVFLAGRNSKWKLCTDDIMHYVFFGYSKQAAEGQMTLLCAFINLLYQIHFLRTCSQHCCNWEMKERPSAFPQFYYNLNETNAMALQNRLNFNTSSLSLSRSHINWNFFDVKVHQLMILSTASCETNGCITFIYCTKLPTNIAYFGFNSRFNYF